VKYQTFATWLQKRKGARDAHAKVAAKGVVKTESVRWLEAVVQDEQQTRAGAGHAIVLEVRGGGRVQINNSNQLAIATQPGS
jgi:hypothetical protein